VYVHVQSVDLSEAICIAFGLNAEAVVAEANTVGSKILRAAMAVLFPGAASAHFKLAQ
jgi:hypothetical protein